MNAVLLGSPGAGKGTQSRFLAEDFGLVHLSTGGIFREEMAAKTELGERVSRFVSAGRLVPDDLVVETVAKRIEGADAGCLFDGFPRTVAQAEALDRALARRGKRLDLVVYLRLPAEEAIRRLTARRVCAGCGAEYNLQTRPPKAEGKCDACGGGLSQREDDAEDTVKKRLMVFEDLTQPLVSYYRGQGLLREVDGAGPIPDVRDAVRRVVEHVRAAEAGGR